MADLDHVSNRTAADELAEAFEDIGAAQGLMASALVSMASDEDKALLLANAERLLSKAESCIGAARMLHTREARRAA